MNYYCIACKSTRELKVIEKLEKTFSTILKDDYDLQFVFPQKETKEKRAKKYYMVNKPLTPGYIFLRSKLELAKYKVNFYLASDCYGLVKSNYDNTFTLKHNDKFFAQWVFDYKGLIKPSLVKIKIGVCVQVVSGPLADYKGEIVNVDKRNNKVLVYLNSVGNIKKTWLPIDIIKEDDEKDNLQILKEFSKTNSKYK